MPFRFKGGYATSEGVTTTGKRKTFVGRGPAPAGAKKIKAPARVPTVTSHGSTITTSGFSSPRAARTAVRQTRSSQARVRAVEGRQAQALTYHRKTQERASERSPRVPTPPARMASLGGAGPGPANSGLKSPSYKPPKFQGAKTAGTPSIKELNVAARQGTLRTNRKGYVTTPAVRKVAGTLRRLGTKARQSNSPLPGLGPEESQIARKVLRTGQKEGAGRKEKLAAAETGLVESGFKNLPGGDADSEGWRQERTSIYGTGPTGPRNVKAGAQRFFSEAKEQGGATAGELAANVQRPAEQYRGRYDERKPEANAIVKAFEQGGLKPAQQRKLAVAKAEARKLGLQAAKAPANKAGRLPSVVYIGKVAEKKFGLHVGENPAFGGVSPVHVEDSYHYRRDKKGRGEAIDASGTPEAMAAFDQWVAKKYGSGVTELFYDPGISIKEGTEIGAIGGHEDHVHVAIAQPGETFGGSGYTAGSGGAMFVGYGSSASAAASSATSAAKAAGEGKGRRTPPLQKVFRKLKRLDELGAGVSEAPAKTEDKGAILASLERTYGKKAA